MILRFVQALGLIIIVLCSLGAELIRPSWPQLNVHILSHYYVTSILIQSHYFVIYILI